MLPPLLRRVSVIVPVYDAHDHVERCLAALTSTLSSRAAQVRVLLVDDRSPDPRIAPLLRDFAASSMLDVEVVERDVDGGFVDAVNDGLARTGDDDVVLLNSDTRPAGDWLGRLSAAVHERGSNRGLAFPASSSASVFSVPLLDPATAALSPDVAAGALADRFDGRADVVPTGVGFCLFITREVLRDVGGLDRAFGRGYGEENDLCMRARDQGYEVVFVPGALVLHDGGASMVAAGIRAAGDTTVEANERLLMARHPSYEGEVTDPRFRAALDASLWSIERCMIEALARADAPVVHICHLEPRPISTGGIERYVDALMAAQAQRGLAVLIHPRHDALVVTCRVGDCAVELASAIPAAPFGARTDHSSTVALAGLVAAFAPAYAHVHSVIGSCLDLSGALADAGVRCVYTLHDYYLASPNMTLLASNATGPDAAGWSQIEHYFGTARWRPDAWTRAGARFAASATLVVAPTAAARRTLEEHLGPIDNAVVLPHPEQREIVGDAEQRRTPDGDPRVLFLGASHLPEKGRTFLAALVPLLLDRGLRCEFLGSGRHHWTGCPFARDRRVTFHGAYRQDDAVRRIREIGPTVGVLASPWSETWSYTLSELWLAGVPCATTDRGAPAERVRAAGAGIVIADDPAAAADQIAALARDRATTRTMATAALAAMRALPGVDEHLAAIEAALSARPVPASSTPSAPTPNLVAYREQRALALVAEQPTAVDRARAAIKARVPPRAMPAIVAVKKQLQRRR